MSARATHASRFSSAPSNRHVMFRQSCWPSKPPTWRRRILDTLCAATIASWLLLGPSHAVLAEDEITLNLQDTDITALINTVSEITGKNFVIDPRVKAKVTVVSSKPMNADELYNVFLSILQVHGIAAIEAGEVVKIVPDVSAKQTAPPTVTKDIESDEMVTRVIALKNVSANQVVPILRPLVPQYGHLAAYAPTNVLIISDRASNISRLDEIIRSIDREATSEVEFFQLRYASAGEVARILTSLQTQARAKTEPGPAPTIVADERTNSVLISGEPSDRVAMRGLIAKLDMPISGGAANVIYLRYAKAADLATILDNMFKSAQGAGGQPAAGGTATPVIQADEATNSLIIDADSEQLNRIRAIIRQLDIRRRQVLVEAVLAEVSIDTQRELGIEMAAGDADTAILGSLLPPAIGGGLAELAAGGPPGPGLTVGAGDLNGNTQFAILLRALQGDGNTNVLSTPTLVTLDNEEASIVVGQNVPFVTGQFTGTGSTIPENPFQTIERQDVGLTLKVKPQINEGDAVQLEITTEVSSVTNETIASDIITNKREIKTNVLVTDGQVVVLGGLISDEVTESVRKIPGLGDIPGFGELFKSRQAKKTKRNLMVFIHPVILKEDLTYRYTQGKYRYMRSQQELARERAPFKSMPYPAQVMPPLEDVQAPPGLEGERPIYPAGAKSPSPGSGPETQGSKSESVAEQSTTAPEPATNQREWWEPDY